MTEKRITDADVREFLERHCVDHATIEKIMRTGVNACDYSPETVFLMPVALLGGQFLMLHFRGGRVVDFYRPQWVKLEGPVTRAEFDALHDQAVESEFRRSICCGTPAQCALSPCRCAPGGG